MKVMAEYFNEEAKKHDDLFVRQMGMTEFYDEIERQLDKSLIKNNILVLGCGTGLEIERIRCKANVTAIDIASEMIIELEKKVLYPEVTLKTICGSFLDLYFGLEAYDLVLTCYAMHHFNEKQKIELYRNIRNSLTEGGVFLNGDSMEKSHYDELRRLQEAEQVYAEKNMSFGSLHIDSPFCWEHELEVLKKAGFTEIGLERVWTRTKLYRAKK